MDKVYIVGGIALLVIIFIMFWGDRKIRIKDKMLDEIAVSENSNLEFISYLAYHGGYPQMPKPQKLNLALSDEYLLFFNNQGWAGKIFFSDSQKIEKFVTKKDPDLKGKSIVLWGPFVGIFLKPAIRFFIAINYRDINGNNNNLLLETSDDKELQQVYSRIQKPLYSS